MTDDLRAKIAELRRLDTDRRTYPHVGIAGAMRLDQALQIGDFLANEAERLAAENERLRAALKLIIDADDMHELTQGDIEAGRMVLEGKP